MRINTDTQGKKKNTPSTKLFRCLQKEALNKRLPKPKLRDCIVEARLSLNFSLVFVLYSSLLCLHSIQKFSGNGYTHLMLKIERTSSAPTVKSSTAYSFPTFTYFICYSYFHNKNDTKSSKRKRMLFQKQSHCFFFFFVFCI